MSNNTQAGTGFTHEKVETSNFLMIVLILLVVAVGVPFTDEQVAKAGADVKGKSEMDALVAYLQSLGLALK